MLLRCCFLLHPAASAASHHSISNDEFSFPTSRSVHSTRLERQLRQALRKAEQFPAPAEALNYFLINLRQQQQHIVTLSVHFHIRRTLPHTSRRSSTKSTTRHGIALWAATLDRTWPTRRVTSSTSTWDRSPFCCSRAANLLAPATPSKQKTVNTFNTQLSNTHTLAGATKIHQILFCCCTKLNLHALRFVSLPQWEEYNLFSINLHMNKTTSHPPILSSWSNRKHWAREVVQKRIEIEFYLTAQFPFPQEPQKFRRAVKGDQGGAAVDFQMYSKNTFVARVIPPWSTFAPRPDSIIHTAKMEFLCQSHR